MLGALARRYAQANKQMQFLTTCRRLAYAEELYRAFTFGAACEATFLPAVRTAWGLNVPGLCRVLGAGCEMGCENTSHRMPN